MAAFVQCRQQERNFGTVMEERKDDDLALFHELDNRATEKNEFLLNGSDGFGDQLAPKQDRPSIFKAGITVPARRTGVDAFLNSENDKTDYDWLLTPPDTPLFPSLEMEPKNNIKNQIAISNDHNTAPESRHAKQNTQPASKNNETLKPASRSISANRRPSSSGGPTPTASRAATPTGRATLPAMKKTSRPSTPTSRPMLPATTKPARSSTPTQRAAVPSTTKPIRPTTPTSRASTRPSTPTSRASLPSTTRPNRPSTPTSRASLPSTTKPNRPSTPTSRTSLPATTKPNRPLTPTSRPTLKNPAPSRGISPTVKSRPLISPEITNNTPPNLRTSLPNRPLSASRSRPGPPSARSSSNGRTRQNVSAPTNGFAVLAMSRGHSMNGDDVNPVLMGTKMVERVVNMRKLVPPKQDDYVSNNSSGKPISSQENLGRTLSKTSLDMAIRHMDITKRTPGNLRPLVTNIPASSVYSVRTRPTKSRTVSSSDSPLATSSNASSDPSINIIPTFLDGIEDNSIDKESEKLE